MICSDVQAFRSLSPPPELEIYLILENTFSIARRQEPFLPLMSVERIVFNCFYFCLHESSILRPISYISWLTFVNKTCCSSVSVPAWRKFNPSIIINDLAPISLTIFRFPGV